MKNAKTLQYIVKHSLPGRMRLTYPALLSHGKLIHALKAYLSEKQGVTRVVTNHYSGSVTIYHDPQTIEDRKLFNMLDHVTREQLFRIERRISKTEKAGSENEAVSANHKGRWKFAGKLLGGIGLMGVFLPLIPAFPLLFLAAFCKEKADVGNN